MPDLTAKRTLVKSPPELWEELSEVEGLTKHFGAFGEIKITKLEPEHTVAWEGEHGSGTVSIEPSGWGTKVTLHAELPDPEEREAPDEAQEPAATMAEPEPEPAPEEAEAPAAMPNAAADEPNATAAQPNSEPERAGSDRQPEAAGSEPAVTEPESVVAERASDVADQVLVEEPVLVEAVSLPEPEPQRKRRRFWARLFGRWTAASQRSPTPDTTEPRREPVVTEGEPTGAEPNPDAVEGEVKPVEDEPIEDEPVAAADEAEPAPVEPVGVEIDAGPEPVAVEDGAEAAAVEDGAGSRLGASLDPERARVVLDEALDALGAAHHRPFSRG